MATVGGPQSETEPRALAALMAAPPAQHFQSSLQASAASLADKHITRWTAPAEGNARRSPLSFVDKLIAPWISAARQSATLRGFARMFAGSSLRERRLAAGAATSWLFPRPWYLDDLDEDFTGGMRWVWGGRRSTAPWAGDSEMPMLVPGFGPGPSGLPDLFGTGGPEAPVFARSANAPSPTPLAAIRPLLHRTHQTLARMAPTLSFVSPGGSDELSALADELHAERVGGAWADAPAAQLYALELMAYGAAQGRAPESAAAPRLAQPAGLPFAGRRAEPVQPTRAWEVAPVTPSAPTSALASVASAAPMALEHLAWSDRWLARLTGAGAQTLRQLEQGTKFASRSVVAANLTMVEPVAERTAIADAAKGPIRFDDSAATPDDVFVAIAAARARGPGKPKAPGEAHAAPPRPLLTMPPLADRLIAQAPNAPGPGLSPSLAASPLRPALASLLPLPKVPAFDPRVLTVPEVTARAAQAPAPSALPMVASVFSDDETPWTGRPGATAEVTRQLAMSTEIGAAGLAHEFVSPEMVLAARVYGLSPAAAATATRTAVGGSAAIQNLAATVEFSLVKAPEGDRSLQYRNQPLRTRGAVLWPPAAIAGLGIDALSPDGPGGLPVAALEVEAARLVAEQADADDAPAHKRFDEVYAAAERPAAVEAARLLASTSGRRNAPRSEKERAAWAWRVLVNRSVSAVGPGEANEDDGEDLAPTRAGLSPLASRAGQTLGSYVTATEMPAAQPTTPPPPAPSRPAPAPATQPSAAPELVRSGRAGRFGAGEVEIPAWFEQAARRMFDQQGNMGDGMSLAELTLVQTATPHQVAAAPAEETTKPKADAGLGNNGPVNIDVEAIARKAFSQLRAMLDVARWRNSGEP